MAWKVRTSMAGENHAVRQDNVVFYFTDKSRVAIWGWSYGGFVTASVLARDAEKNNIFKVFPPLICY
jgi:hypothetical protein